MIEEITLPVPPEQVWPILSNTNRLNRALGLPAMSVDGAMPASFALKVSSGLPGLKLSWIERPFEWVEGRTWRVVREFGGGPLARFEGAMDLSPQNNGTQLRLEVLFTPRNGVGEWLVRWVVLPEARRRVRALLEEMARTARRGEGIAFPSRRLKTPIHESALKRRVQALRALPAIKGDVEAAADRLEGHIRDGYDDEVTRMRPFELADRWALPRVAALRAFMHGVSCGLLDMSWEVLCPNCARPEILSGLSKVKPASHCDTCRIDYGVDFDNSVELRFSVNAAVRSAVTAVYCAGSPAHAPFAVAQQEIAPASRRDVELDLAGESYVLRNLQGGETVALRPNAEGPGEVSVELAGVSVELFFRPGKVRLNLRNPGAVAALVRLERESWKDRAARASMVSMVPEFRTLFSSEVLAPDVQIAVRNVALLFSDLKDSTALYARAGEARAYAVVQKHFEYLFSIIEGCGGSVVKTIGDAVMAAFPSATLAVEAALRIQERIAELSKSLEPKPPVVIKLGVHHGPAFVVGANGALDYFGTTVNVAARIQNESKGADLVVSDGVYEDPGVREVLAAHAHEAQEFAIRLKGLSESYDLWRLRPKAQVG